MELVLRLGEEDARLLREQAEIERRSTDEVVLAAIREYVQRHRAARIREILDEALPRYQGLLDRLKDT